MILVILRNEVLDQCCTHVLFRFFLMRELTGHTCLSDLRPIVIDYTLLV